MKLHIKFIAILLCIATLMVYLPISVFADAFDFSSEDTETAEVSPETNTTIQDTENVFEVAELREETVKHFHLDDGTYIAAQYAKPIHYQNEDGTWLDIDNTLSDNGSEISTSNARIKFAKKITGNENLFTLHDGNYKMTWSLDGAIKKTEGVATNTQTQHDETATTLQKMMTLDKLTSRVLYADILDGVDIEYVIDSYDIKENIIVKEKRDAYSYTFNMKLNNLVAAMSESGDIIISDSATGDQVYVIDAPTAYDANGANASSADVSYTLAGGGNGKYALTVTASAEWMNAAERVFPVTIDPPVSVANTSMVMTVVNSVYPSSSYYSTRSDQTINICNNMKAYWRLTELPAIPSSAYISKVVLSLRVMQAQGDYIGAYSITSDWDTTLTWNDTISATPEGAFSSDVVDHQLVDTSNKWYSWDITSVFSGWVDGEDNFGIGFSKISGDSEDLEYTKIYSNISEYESLRPRLAVYYKDMKGIESYWSYTSQDVGLAGTSYINNATRQVSIVKPLMSTMDALMPFTPTLVYNSALANMEVEYPNAEMSYSGTYTSRGFKLNIQETIIKKQYIDSSGETYYTYILSDADGTEHYFLPVLDADGNETTKYIDEDGLRLELDTTNYNSYLTITDSDQTVRTYTKLESAPSDDVLGGWYLTSIADKYGNKIEFTFNQYKNPTAISLIPNGHTTAITFLQIAYTDDYLPFILWNPTSKEAVIMRYSATPTGNITTTGGQYLRSITYAHSSSALTLDAWRAFWADETASTGITIDGAASYTYNSKGRITKASDDLSDYAISYSINSAGTLRYIEEKGRDGATGQRLTFKFGAGYATVQSLGTDNTLGTADDIYTRYVFDNEGRARSVYSYRNNDRIIASASGAYETQENIKNNLKPTTTSVGSPTNYLLNGGLVNNNGVFEHWTQTTNIAGGAFTNTSAEDAAARFTPQANTTDKLTQYTRLPSGTYTLSANVETLNADGVSIIMRATSMNGNGVTEEVFAINELETLCEEAAVSMQITSTTGSTTLTGDEFMIEIIVVGGSTVNEDCRVLIDDVLLEENTGVSQFSLLEMGSFDDFAIDWQTTPLSLIGSVWKDQNGAAIVPTSGGSVFGEVGAVSGSISEERYLVQTIQSPNIPAYLYYPRSMDFVISGYGKATGQTPAGEFRLRVEVDYRDKDEQALHEDNDPNNDIPYIFYFDFLDSSENWQYICDSFTTASYRIDSIKVYCEYSHQAGGQAMFDNISLIWLGFEKTDKVAYSADGQLIYKKTGSYEESYFYNEKNQITRVANNRGELVDYKYVNSATSTVEDNENGHVLREEYHYTFEYTDNGSVDYLWEWDHGYYDEMWAEYVQGLYEEAVASGNTSWTPPEKPTSSTNLELTLKKVIQYTRNAHGQVIAQTVYVPSSNDTGDDCTSVVQVVTYTYSTASNIYGTLIAEQVNNEYKNKYFYDSVSGDLLASVRVDLVADANGVYQESYTNATGSVYWYDTHGNLMAVLPAQMYSNGNWDIVQDAEEVSYSYNALNQLSDIRTESTTYNFVYNDFGNTESISVGSQEIAYYEYNAKNGNLKLVEYGNGTTVRYAYDDLDNIKEIWYNMGAGEVLAYEYSYTSNGQLSMLDDHIDGKRTSYKYDPTGRMAYYTVSDIPTNGQSPESDMFVRLSYDSYSRLTGKYTALGIPALADDATVQDMYLGVYESYGYDHDGTLTGMSYSTAHDITGDCVNLNISYGYDSLDRLSSKSFTLQSFDYAIYDYAEFELSNIYTYKLNGIYSTGLINSFIVELNETRVDQYNYTYDNNGNITKITTSSGYEYRYVYDDLGQLIREDNSENNNTYLYTYDNAGNILSKQICPYTAAGVTPTPTTTYTYTYGNSNWGDQLTAYRGQAITYDNIGNPLTYYNGKSYTFTWTQGRRLASADAGWYDLTFEYNADGIRTSKTVNGVEYKYTLDGTKILTQEWGNQMLIFLYDEAGSPVGFQYRNSTYDIEQYDTYWYRKNLQGDVVAIYDAYGTQLVSYRYDAWGNFVVSYQNNGVLTNAIHNPFTYRGYYYDSETGFYYLNSRYYDPATCRFINADGYTSTGQGILGNNMYAYCGNNPVMRVDPAGEIWILKSLLTTIVTVVDALGKAQKKSNLLANTAIHGSIEDSVNLKPIDSQHDDNIENMQFGLSTMGNAGCEVIAYYNLKCVLGMRSTLALSVWEVQTYGDMMLGGFWGTNPRSLGAVFAANNISYTNVELSDIDAYGYYIISYWNGGRITGGIHTVLLRYDEEGFYAYNKARNKTANPSEYANAYICGYYFGPG